MVQALWQKLIDDPKNSIKFYEKNSRRADLEKKYSDKFPIRTNLINLTSFANGKKLPIFRLFRYKEAFSQNFVTQFLDELHIGRDDYVLDPFSGIGTTCFGCMLKGIPSVGIEMLPYAYFMSKAIVKLCEIKPEKLMEFFKLIEKKVPNSELADIALDVPIVRKSFDEDTLTELRKWKFQIDLLENSYRDVFQAIFLSVLEDCSYSAKDGQFLRLVPNKSIKKPKNALREKILQAEKDIHIIKKQYQKLLTPKLIIGDTRNLSSYFLKGKKPNLVITSPPYLNRYDYTRSYVLELCFNFIKNHDELKKIRFGILRSHIECKTNDDDKELHHPVVTEILKKLESKNLNNPRIPVMITAYFVDMKKAIQEISKTLDKKAKIILVVNNVRFEGEMIPVDLILSEFAEQCGFKIKNILIVRYKGNSSQQMKKYGLAPARESILILER